MKILQIATIAIAVLALLIPIYVQYDLHSRGDNPEKTVEIQYLGSINLLNDLSVLGEKLNVSLSINNNIVSNIYLSQTMLKNVGNSPILPTDIFDNLSIHVGEPWKIIAVSNYGHELKTFIPMEWKRISDTEFQAEKALINPGDTVWAKVYVTNTSYDPNTKKDNSTPKIEWSGRVSNLKKFTETPTFIDEIKKNLWFVQIELTGWSMIFFLFSSTIYQTLYFVLLPQAGFFCPWKWKATGIALLATLLSLSASEAESTYLYPTYIMRLIGISHWLNAPWIILNSLFLIYLSVTVWKKRKEDARFFTLSP